MWTRRFLSSWQWGTISGHSFERASSPTRRAGDPAQRMPSWVRSVSGPPAGPHVFGDCARELTLPIHPTVCFEAGWFTLTQTSWTKLRRRSRKWISGHAATALATRTIEDSSEPDKQNRLGMTLPPGQGKSPFSLDGYLSWMSPSTVSPSTEDERLQ